MPMRYFQSAIMVAWGNGFKRISSQCSNIDYIEVIIDGLEWSWKQLISQDLLIYFSNCLRLLAFISSISNFLISLLKFYKYSVITFDIINSFNKVNFFHFLIISHQLQLYNLYFGQISMGIIFPKIKDESRVFKIGKPNSHFSDNKIDTAKYNLITFLPKSLLLQFTRLSNVVFLANAVLQSIPLISTISPITAIGPLAFVLGLSMLREGYEDYKRHKKDWETNSRRTMVFRDDQFIEIQWDKIRVGEFIKIKNEQFIPADIVLIYSSSQTEICYVETSNLDGETNLKQKFVLSEIASKYSNQLHSIKGLITAQKPTSNLYDFTGQISLDDEQSIFVDYGNLLLRDTFLKNTDQIIGIAVYCGHDSKILKNQGNIHHKMSSIQKKTNYIQIGLVVILVLLCSISSLGYFILHNQYNLRSTNSYIPLVGLSSPIQSLVMFFTIFLLLNFLIPITLNILIEGIKTFSALFLSFDKKLYDKSIKKYCGILNSSIIQQLGLIDCVLTDKTGTLTANEMIFRTIAIQDKVYLREYIQEHISALSNNEQFHNFMVGMILCHDVVLDIKKQQYQGSSPDEVCFINFASQIGFKFLSKTKNIVQIQIFGKKRKYNLIDIISFSSRKRMSVIVSEKSKIVMYTKGADSAIFQKAHWYRESQIFNYNIDAFAKQGLRTLVFAKKSLKSKQLRDYLLNKQKIKMEMRQRIISKQEGGDRQRILIQQLENNLQIIGATGIQDKLQQDVPQTLSRLQQAQIRIMMITGDKLQTAQNIGYLSQMIKQDYKVYKISVDILDIHQYALLIKNQTVDPTPFTLMVEGRNIAKMMQQENEDAASLYINLMTRAKSVIFCRSSPKEKALIVKFVKQKMKLIVLAIGDGGNDVGMIEQSHIGVGILGKEGNAAAGVSDFSFGKFKFLDRLILHHGRWFYYRLSYFFVFFGIKNMAITVIIFLYLIDSAFSGNLIFSELFYLLYNSFIGVAMLVYYGLYDQDINDDLQTHMWNYLPQLYKQTKESKLFTYRRYILWSLSGAILAIFIYYLVKFSMMSIAADSSGRPTDYQTARILNGCILNFIILILNYADTQTHTYFFLFFVFGVCSVLTTTSYFVAQNYMPVLLYQIYSDNVNMKFCLTVFLITTTIYLAKVALQCIRIEYFPTIIDLYKKAKSQNEQKKVEIFQKLMKKTINGANNSYSSRYPENKDWTSNIDNLSLDVLKVDRKYKSATINIINTQQCLKQEQI